MSKLGPIRWRELVRRLRALGFEGPYQEGPHPFVVRRAFRLRIPNPHAEEIGASLLARVLREGKITRQEWDSTK